jgi:hypothetical protein
MMIVLILVCVVVCAQIVFEELCKKMDANRNDIVDENMVWDWDQYGEPALSIQGDNGLIAMVLLLTLLNVIMSN